MIATAEAAATHDTAIEILNDVLARDPDNTRAQRLLSRAPGGISAARAELRRAEAEEIRRVRREEQERERAEAREAEEREMRGGHARHRKRPRVPRPPVDSQFTRQWFHSRGPGCAARRCARTPSGCVRRPAGRGVVGRPRQGESAIPLERGAGQCPVDVRAGIDRGRRQPNQRAAADGTENPGRQRRPRRYVQRRSRTGDQQGPGSAGAWQARHQARAAARLPSGPLRQTKPVASPFVHLRTSLRRQRRTGPSSARTTANPGTVEPPPAERRKARRRRAAARAPDSRRAHFRLDRQARASRDDSRPSAARAETRSR